MTPPPTQATYSTEPRGVAPRALPTTGHWNDGKPSTSPVSKDPSQPAPNEGALRRELNAIKRTGCPWMMEVTVRTPGSHSRPGCGLKNWFQSLSGKREGPKASAPAASAKASATACKVHGNLIAVNGCRVACPPGWVRMREPLRFAGNIQSATVSRRAHTWRVALARQTDNLPARSESQAAVGWMSSASPGGVF